MAPLCPFLPDPSGKYVPAFSMAVHEANLAGVDLPNGQPIPLVGLSIGDGMMDPRSQVPGYGSLLFGLSLIDEKQRDYMTSVEKEIIALVDQQRWVEAFRLFDPLMMSDEFPYPSYFTNVTGFTGQTQDDQGRLVSLHCIALHCIALGMGTLRQKAATSGAVKEGRCMRSWSEWTLI